MSVSALSGILRRKGFEVLIAHTVADGLRLLSHSPDWILLDLMLPDGDGDTILQHIRAHRLPLKEIVTTAVNDPARLDRIHALRPEQVMKKPLDLARLLRTFELKH